MYTKGICIVEFRLKRWLADGEIPGEEDELTKNDSCEL